MLDRSPALRRPLVRALGLLASLSGATAALAAGPRWIDVNNSEPPARLITGAFEWDPDGAGPEGTVLVVGSDQAANAGGFQAAADRAWAFRFNGVDWAPLGRSAAFNFPAPARDFTDHAGSLIAAAGSVLRFDGTEWSVIGTPNAGGSVTEVISFNGDLFAAGNFTAIDGVPANNIARHDGTQWHAVAGGVTGGAVNDLELFENFLIVGGAFTQADGNPATALAVWTGSEWGTYSGEITGPAPVAVTTLSATPDMIYIGGNFVAVAGFTAGFCVARDTNDWVPLPQLTAAPDAIRAAGAGVFAVGNAFASPADPNFWRGLVRLDGAAWELALESQSAQWNLSSSRFVLSEYRSVPIIGRSAISSPTLNTIGAVNGSRTVKVGVNAVGANSFIQTAEGPVLAGRLIPDWTRAGFSSVVSRWTGSEFVETFPELKARSVTAVYQLGDDLVIGGDFAPGNIAGARRIAARTEGVWSSLDAGIPYVAASDRDFIVDGIGVHGGALHIGLTPFVIGGPDPSASFQSEIWRRSGAGWQLVPGITTVPLIFGGGTPPLTFDRFAAAFGLGFRSFLTLDGDLFASGNYILRLLNGQQTLESGDPIRLNAASGWSRIRPVAGGWTLDNSHTLNLGGIWTAREFRGDTIIAGAVTPLTGAFGGLAKLTPNGWAGLDTRPGAPALQGLLGGNSFTRNLPVARALIDRNGLLFAAGIFSSAADALPTSPQLAPGMSSIAAYNGEGWVNLTWRDPATGQLAQGLTTVNGTTAADVFNMTLHNDRLLVLGTFARAGGLSSPNIAVFDPGAPPAFVSSGPVTLTACPSSALLVAAPAVTFADADQWRHYQWFKGGLPLAENTPTPSGFGVYTGTQSATLTITNAQPSDSQSLTLKVTTIGGIAWSPVVTPRILPDVSATPNGIVDTADLIFFLGRFGEAAPPGSPAARVDFNTDRVVNTPDLITFLGRFGLACSG